MVKIFHTLSPQSLLDMINKHGSTSPIWCCVQSWGNPVYVAVSPKYAREMCNEMLKKENNPNDVMIDVELQEFSSLIIKEVHN